MQVSQSTHSPQRGVAHVTVTGDAQETGQASTIPPGARLLVFEFLTHHAQESTAFNRAMLAAGAGQPAAVAEAYDFSGVHRLVDAGGGIGTRGRGWRLLRRVARERRRLRDVPHPSPLGR